MWNGKTSIYKVQAILLVRGPGVETADVSRRLIGQQRDRYLRC
jgi:hypothetical protein